jgi:hypothetical protein
MDRNAMELLMLLLEFDPFDNHSANDDNDDDATTRELSVSSKFECSVQN